MNMSGSTEETRLFFRSNSLASLSEHCLVEGEKPALITFTRQGRRDHSRETLADWAARLAEGLRRDGLEPGEAVLVLAPSSPSCVAAFLAILRAGGCVAPIDIQMNDAHLGHVFENSEARRVFTTKRLRERLEHLGRGQDSRIFLLDAEDSEPDSWHNLFAGDPGRSGRMGGDDRAMLFYTSGTTGPPKGVPLSHANLIAQIRSIEQTGMLTSRDRMLLPLPLHHVYPVTIGVLAPLALQAPIVLPAGLTGAAITRAMRDGRASIVLGIPRLYRAVFQGISDRMAASGRPAHLLFQAMLTFSRLGERLGLHMGRRLFGSLHKKTGPDIRIMASGGSALDPRLRSNLEALGWPVMIGYGLTETSPLLTLRWPSEGHGDSVGRTLHGVELRRDPSVLAPAEAESSGQKEPASFEQPGELLVRGPNVFSGYHKLPEKTEQSFSGSWFRTGDIARFDRQGHLHLQGRISTMIVREGGENVDPEKVEKAYEECAEIQEIGVLEDGGALAALVVPSRELILQQTDRALQQRIRQALDSCGSRLPSYQRVSSFQTTTTPLERTRLGKVKRRQLQQAYEAARAGGKRTEKNRSGPVAEKEMPSDVRVLMGDERVRILWNYLAKRYADKPLSPESHLEFDLEIDSMEWVELSLALEEQIDIPLDESRLGQISSVRDLMELVAEHEGDAVPRIRRALTEPEAVLSRDDQAWAEPRGPLRRAVFTALYGLGRLLIPLFFRITVTGRERVPARGPFILLPNHISLLDAPILGIALGYRRLRRLFWSGSARLLFQRPLTRAFSRVIQAVPIERQTDPVSSLAFGALLLKRKHPLVWFPEGGVSPGGELRPFRQGIGHLLEHYDRPVIPVFLEGTRQGLPPGRVIPRPARIAVHFGEALEAADLRAPDEAATEQEATHRRIVRKLEAAMARLRNTKEDFARK